MPTQVGITVVPTHRCLRDGDFVSRRSKPRYAEVGGRKVRSTPAAYTRTSLMPELSSRVVTLTVTAFAEVRVSTERVETRKLLTVGARLSVCERTRKGAGHETLGERFGRYVV